MDTVKIEINRNGRGDWCVYLNGRLYFVSKYGLHTAQAVSDTLRRDIARHGVEESLADCI